DNALVFDLLRVGHSFNRSKSSRAVSRGACDAGGRGADSWITAQIGVNVMRSRKPQAITVHDAIAAIREVFGNQFAELGSDLRLLELARVHARLKRDAGNIAVPPLVLLKFSLHF